MSCRCMEVSWLAFAMPYDVGHGHFEGDTFCEGSGFRTARYLM